MADLKPIIKDSFIQYAGAVLQSRALVDVRDCLKPSARQIFYSMLNRKLVHKNPYKKTANAVGMAMADFYIHGDSSCEGVIMRAGQDFAMRYPLVDVKGNMGSLIESGNWAAMRYTESRLSLLSDILFKDIDEFTITEWQDNYDNTQQYPRVLPTKGFYNLVNGSTGIGIGMASSLPQFNLTELNEALIKLLWNPDIDFSEIYCAPDFATGAILINESQVKESLKNGQGFACKLRSVISYEKDENCLIVTEIPYGVYTNTICGELAEIIESEENPGIDKFNDLTGSKPLIKIYLTKQANPDKVLRYLYKNTSLQSHFGINFTMLDNGKYPKVFTWKEALQAHLTHEYIVYENGYKRDLKKIENRLHIIEGLFKAISMIDEVVATIKAASDTKSANLALQKLLLIDEDQAKAILDIKLARLAHLEIDKLTRERDDLVREQNRIRTILSDETLMKKEIEKGLRDVIKQLGDARRTQIMDLGVNSDDETVEIKNLQLLITNKNNLFINETSSLLSQKRGSVGSKLKLVEGEYVISSCQIQSNEEILFFSNKGMCYHTAAREIAVNTKLSLYSVIALPDSENICAVSSTNKKNLDNYIMFITQKGIIKKSLLSEYNIKRAGAIKALTLDDDDVIVSVIITDDTLIGMATQSGNFLLIESDTIRPIGRVARGVIGIKLGADDMVIAAHAIPYNAKTIVSVSGNGLIKQTDIEEFTIQNKNTKGSKIQKLGEYDWLADFESICGEDTINVISTAAALSLRVNDIPLLSKVTQGVKSIKLKEKDSVINLSKI